MEKTELYNVLKIAWFATMDKQKYICIKCRCGMIKSSNLDGLSILLPQISLIQPELSIFNSSSSILSQKNRIFDLKSLQAWFPGKCPQAPLPPLPAFFRSVRLFLFVKVMRDFNFIFVYPEISCNFWDFRPNFCMWPLKIASTLILKVGSESLQEGLPSIRVTYQNQDLHWDKEVRTSLLSRC